MACSWAASDARRLAGRGRQHVQLAGQPAALVGRGRAGQGSVRSCSARTVAAWGSRRPLARPAGCAGRAGGRGPPGPGLGGPAAAAPPPGCGRGCVVGSCSGRRRPGPGRRRRQHVGPPAAGSQVGGLHQRGGARGSPAATRAAPSSAVTVARRARRRRRDVDQRLPAQAHRLGGALWAAAWADATRDQWTARRSPRGPRPAAAWAEHGGLGVQVAGRAGARSPPPVRRCRARRRPARAGPPGSAARCRGGSGSGRRPPRPPGRSAARRRGRSSRGSPSSPADGGQRSRSNPAPATAAACTRSAARRRAGPPVVTRSWTPGGSRCVRVPAAVRLRARARRAR